MKWLVRLTVLVLSLGIATAQTKKAAKTDAEIKREILKQSIASYRGSCPCPYNVDRAGRMCGRRSAYSRSRWRFTVVLREGCDAEDGGRLQEENEAIASFGKSLCECGPGGCLAFLPTLAELLAHIR
jgi:hypothetical protein